jgi:hypothetical protein
MDIKKPRLLGIDFLRFVCASLVFTAHFISNVDEINNLYWKKLIHNTKILSMPLKFFLLLVDL